MRGGGGRGPAARPVPAPEAYADDVVTWLPSLEATLGVLALVALVVGILAFVGWFVAPRVGAAPSRARGLAFVWIGAFAAAAVLGLLVFVIGRDVIHLF